MTDKKDRTKERAVSESRALMLSMIRSMGEVTWRMFGPPVILVPLGLWADVSWRTKPWLTILSTVVALSLSVVLVRQQMRSAQ